MTNAPTQPVKDWKNLFGVCACLGEDFGFNPIWLRLTFGVALIWSPVLVIGGYFALGAVVLLSRLMVRSRAVSAGPVANAARIGAGNDEVALPLAA